MTTEWFITRCTIYTCPTLLDTRIALADPINTDDLPIDSTNRIAKFLDGLAPVLLGFCAATSIALLVFKPIPHGHDWQSAPTVTMYMIGIWLVYRWRPRWFVENRWLLGFVLFAVRPV